MMMLLPLASASRKENDSIGEIPRDVLRICVWIYHLNILCVIKDGELKNPSGERATKNSHWHVLIRKNSYKTHTQRGRDDGKK
jgi:hypothetical protein